jgi:hypothetical protein
MNTKVLALLVAFWIAPVHEAVAAGGDPANNCEGTVTKREVGFLTYVYELSCIGSCDPDTPCTRSRRDEALVGPNRAYCACSAVAPAPGCCHIYVDFEVTQDEDGDYHIFYSDIGHEGSCSKADCPIGGICQHAQADPDDWFLPIDYVAYCPGSNVASRSDVPLTD